MIRTKLLTGVLSVLFIFSAVLVFAGELPPGTATKGKTVSGEMTIILMDESNPDQGLLYVIVGTCNKNSFQIGPAYDDGALFGAITETDLFQFFFPPPVAEACEPPSDYQGYAITGLKNWVKTNNIISAEAFLQPVVLSKKPPKN
jgi:hypothetical protein